MADDEPTQKRISQRYDGAADYPRRAHYFRGLRSWLFAIAVVATILGALAFNYWGNESAYSPGPISRTHANLDCRACHLEADGFSSKLAKLASHDAEAKTARASSSISRMDAACLECHASAQLHVPQAASVGLRTVSTQLTLVHATACATCHREHAGHERRALPSQQTCVSCHSDAGALTRAQQSVKLENTPVAAAGENRNLGDGIVRFVPPARSPGALPAFASYAEGHPPFAYEQSGVRDPAALKFNHERHLRADLPQVNGHRLTCVDCHRPGAGGAFFQPVKYEQHCAQCHTLLFQPSLPKLRIPHGDPQKVRYFLAGREAAFELALRVEGVSDPVELKQRVQVEMQALERRVGNDLDSLEKRVFFEGDPPDRAGDRLTRADTRKFLTECAKCHAVSPGSAEHAPKVQPPNMAERWVQRGPFTHLPHQHMECIDCHGAAKRSRETTDILLPPQTLCAECHRPPASPTRSVTAPAGDAHTHAAFQRANGGIKWGCTDCHGFHAPSDAQRIISGIAPSSEQSAAAR